MDFKLADLTPSASTVTSVIIGIALLIFLWWFYHHVVNTMPVGALSVMQYGQLAPAAQGNYAKTADGYYVPKGTPATS